MPSTLLKILPPATIGILGTSITLRHTLFGPRSVSLSAPEETLASNYHWILVRPYKLHHALFIPQIVPFRPPEESLASNYPWIFRIALQASPHPLQSPEFLS
ncbi:hypothetical protein L195_g036556 [Trifolium pratense]|uniref:Uncharacterized protein n=1 Tax=Trifolium pratense TaxID=57577 RepID=A0A2K3LPU0_TRIPR|nr:hypothetical protein L195_g036556 [Trifolium pratense]